MAEKVGEVYIEASIDTNGVINAGKAISKTTNSIEIDLAGVGTAANAVNTNLTKTAAAVESANKKTGAFSGQLGQASFQVSQFVGQVQGGTSAFVAFSQQVADIGYQLGVPLLGAVLSVAAAIGGTLYQSMQKVKGPIKELPEELKKQLEEIKEKYAEIDEESKGAFTQAALGRAASAYDKQAAAIDRLKMQLKTYLDFAKLGSQGAALEAARIGRAITDANRKLQELGAYQDQLNQFLAEGAAAGAEGYKEQTDNASKLVAQLQLATVKLNEGDAAAIRMSAAMTLGLKAGEALPPEVEKAVSALIRAEAAQKALNEQKKTSAQLEADHRKEMTELQNEIQENIDFERSERKKAIDEAIADRKNGAARIADIEKEIYLQQLRNQGSNKQLEIESAIRALGPDSTAEEQQSIADKVSQLQALRFEYELLGDTIQDSIQGVALSALDSFSSGLARVITEGDSAREMFGNLAKSIATELLTAIIRYWVGQAAAAVVGQTAVSAATIAAGGAAAAAWAPAATLASIATLGGAATVGVAALGTGLTAGVGLAAAAQTGSALTAGGGRLYGGPVQAGKMYPVNENGDPELINQGNRQYLIPNARGEVISNKNATAGGGGGNAPIINITNYSGGQASVTGQRFNEQDKRWILDVVVGDMQKRGATHKAMTETTNAVNRTR